MFLKPLRKKPVCCVSCDLRKPLNAAGWCYECVLKHFSGKRLPKEPQLELGLSKPD